MHGSRVWGSLTIIEHTIKDVFSFISPYQTHTKAHTYVCTNAIQFTDVFYSRHTREGAHTHTQTCMHTHMRTHVHTHKRVHTHTHRPLTQLHRQTTDTLKLIKWRDRQNYLL
jgi:hypothetical protein